MPHLSFAELIEQAVPLTTAEAVELTLAVAYVLDAQRVDNPSPRVPGEEAILLGNTGEVTFTTVSASADGDDTAALATLLRQLLQLHEWGALDRRGRVPGELLLLLARALRQVNLPPPDSQRLQDGARTFRV